jgi:hypothetical protein
MECKSSRRATVLGFRFTPGLESPTSGSMKGLLWFCFFFVGVWGMFNMMEKVRPPTTKLQFAGRLSNNDKTKWLNNRLAVTFLDNVEVGRAITQGSEYPSENVSRLSPFSFKAGFQDGIFLLECPNTYRVKASDLKFPKTVETALLSRDNTAKFVESSNAYDFLGAWFGDVQETESFKVVVPEKRVTYEIRILGGDYTFLPEPLKMSGCLRLTDSGVLYYSDAKGAPRLAAGGSAKITFDEGKNRIEKKLLHSLTIPLDNTYGSETIVNEIEDTKTYIHEVTEESGIKVGVSIPLASWLSVQAEIERSHGSRQGEVVSRKVKYRLPVKAGAKTIYRINWYEQWKHGVALISDNGSEESVPYKVRNDVVYEVVSSDR